MMLVEAVESAVTIVRTQHSNNQHEGERRISVFEQLGTKIHAIEVDEMYPAGTGLEWTYASKWPKHSDVCG